MRISSPVNDLTGVLACGDIEHMQHGILGPACRKPVDDVAVVGEGA